MGIEGFRVRAQPSFIHDILDWLRAATQQTQDALVPQEHYGFQPSKPSWRGAGITRAEWDSEG